MSPDDAGLPSAAVDPAWRRPRLTPSLVEVYRSVPVARGTWWRKVLAFAGPGYLVAVGYMDPGNWATDLAGGVAVRLHALERDPDLEPDGDPAPGARAPSSAS